MGEPTKKFTMAGVLGVAVAAATIGGAVVAGIGEYRQSLEAQRDDEQARKQASKAEYPLVKVVMPGLHEDTTPSESTGDPLIKMLTKQLGIIRNYGNGPALNVTLQWISANGEDLGRPWVSPMADLAPQESAEFFGLPTSNLNWSTDNCEITGRLHLTYTDLSGKRYATSQKFEVTNFPTSEPGLQTVITYPIKGRRDKPHTHVR